MNCRIKFCKHIGRYSGRYRKGKSTNSDIPPSEEREKPNNVVPATISKSESMKAKKVVSFVKNIEWMQKEHQ